MRIHAVIGLSCVVGVALVVGSCGGNSADPCAPAPKKCSADPTPSAAQQAAITQACRDTLAGKCAALARKALSCAASKQKCTAENKTDTTALLQDCGKEQMELTQCLAGLKVDGGYSDSAVDGGADVGTDSAKEAGVESGTEAGADAGPDVVTDGATDSGVDGASADGDGGSSPPARLYGLIGTKLVVFDEATAKPTVIGDIAAAGGGAAVSLLAFNPSSGTLYAVRDILGTRELIKVNPCTAAVTPIAPITRAGGAIHLVEGFAARGGVLYASASLDGADLLSESLVTIDATTAVATPVGTFSGSDENEMDHLAVVGGELIGRDAHQGDGFVLHLYDINETTAAATPLVTVPHYVTSFTSGPSAGTITAWILSGDLARQLVVINTAGGAVTPIGVTHTTTELGGANLSALQRVSATCP
jgi:hypothetical protein